MFEILGFENLSFTNPESGELVKGVKLYLRGDMIDSRRGDGHVCLSKFFSSNRILGIPKVGAVCEFEISYNSKGEPKVTGLKVCD